MDSAGVGVLRVGKFGVLPSRLARGSWACVELFLLAAALSCERRGDPRAGWSLVGEKIEPLRGSSIYRTISSRCVVTLTGTPGRRRPVDKLGAIPARSSSAQRSASRAVMTISQDARAILPTAPSTIHAAFSPATFDQWFGGVQYDDLHRRRPAAARAERVRGRLDQGPFPPHAHRQDPRAQRVERPGRLDDRSEPSMRRSRRARSRRRSGRARSSFALRRRRLPRPSHRKPAWRSDRRPPTI